MGSVPDFKNFGTDTYRTKITQRGSTVRLSQRTYLGAITFGVLALIMGFFVFTPMIVRQDYSLSFGRVAGILLVSLFGLGALFYALYREEIFFDFGAEYYRFRKGFLWNIREVRGFFNDIVAVTVTEQHYYSQKTHRSYATFSIGIEYEKESPAFDFWQAQQRKQAEYISSTLASAFGCQVRWKEADPVRRLLSKGKRGGIHEQL